MSLNSINQLIFVTANCCVFFAAGTEFCMLCRGPSASKCVTPEGKHYFLSVFICNVDSSRIQLILVFLYHYIIWGLGCLVCCDKDLIEGQMLRCEELLSFCLVSSSVNPPVVSSVAVKQAC
jgi:hypothetical protein